MSSFVSTRSSCMLIHRLSSSVRAIALTITLCNDSGSGERVAQERSEHAADQAARGHFESGPDGLVEALRLDRSLWGARWVPRAWGLPALRHFVICLFRSLAGDLFRAVVSLSINQDATRTATRHMADNVGDVVCATAFTVARQIVWSTLRTPFFIKRVVPFSVPKYHSSVLAKLRL